MLRNNKRLSLWSFDTWSILLGILLVLGGCAVGPNFIRPKPPTAKSYTFEKEPTLTVKAGGVAQKFERGGKLASDWWRLFGSKKLATVVQLAILENPTLKAAQDSLRQSKETLRAGYGIFYPKISADFIPEQQLFSPLTFGPVLESIPSESFSLYTLQASVGYVLDVWGGERRTIEGLRAQTNAQMYNTLGTYLTLTGNVVNAIVAEAAYSAQIETTRKNIRIFEEQARITALQVKAGTVPYANLVAVQTQVEAARATLPPLNQQLAHTRHLIATLMDQAPGNSAPPRVTLAELTLPKDIPVSLPSQIVRQRPDVLMAEEELHYASAQIGVATAALLPNFTLNADVGWNNTTLPALFVPNSNFWLYGAEIATPVFQGPTLWYQRKAAIQAYQQALENYRQTVLTALAQVADALDAVKHDALTLKAQSEELDAASETLHLIQVSYTAGTANYLQVLMADNQYQQAYLGFVSAEGQRLQDTAALFVALGGGWWNVPTKVAASKASATKIYNNVQSQK